MPWITGPLRACLPGGPLPTATTGSRVSSSSAFIVVILFLGVWGVDDVILSNVRLDVGQSHHLPSSCSPKVRAIGGNAGTRYTEIIKVDGDRTET